MADGSETRNKRGGLLLAGGVMVIASLCLFFRTYVSGGYDYLFTKASQYWLGILTTGLFIGGVVLLVVGFRDSREPEGRFYYGHRNPTLSFIALIAVLLSAFYVIYVKLAVPHFQHLGEVAAGTVGTTGGAFGAASESIADFMQTAGLLAAGAFFAYKLFTGWLVINLSVTMTTARHPLPAGTDLLVINLALDKGTNNTIWLSQIEYRLLLLNHPKPNTPQAKLAFERQTATEINIESPVLQPEKRYNNSENGVFNWTEKTKRRITLAPGEKYTHAKAYEVPHGCVCMVEVVVMGRHPFWLGAGDSQWRAVLVDLPIADS